MLKTFFKPSPFKVGLAVICLSCLLFYSFGQNKPTLLTSLDNRITDAMFRYRGSRPTSGQIVIVDIDEKSLHRIGQMPWPRTIMAQLVKKIHAAEPKALGFDIVFPERDRTSPQNFVEQLSSYLSLSLSDDQLNRIKNDSRLNHDYIFGDAVIDTPTVLGYVFKTENDGLKNTEDVPFPSAIIRVEPPQISYDGLALFQSYRAIVNVPDIAQAETEGFFNVFPDSAGTVRNVPLFMELDGIAYPSLALEMVRLGLNEKEVVILASSQKRGEKNSVLGVSLAERFIPTDAQGQVTVNFRGPKNTFPYISAADVLQNDDSPALKDKFVLIGTSAEGLLDLRATPFSNVFPGVEVHANLIDNILQNDPLNHDIFTEIGLTYTLIIIGGLVLSALLAYSGPLIGGFVSLVFLGGTIIGNYHIFFLNNKIIGVIYPLFTMVALVILITLFNYFFEGREKKFIHSAFGHYVSPDVIDQLMANPDKLSLVGEQKEVTIFFNDIRGFTTISEKMNSGELGRFMNEYLTAMSNIIMMHNGTVDKYIGDAIMAIWGAPLDDAYHAKNAVRASLHMLAELKTLRPQWEDRGLPYIDIGVGLNTGVVSVGNFGSDQRFDYTVIGDNVNLASRLEGSNKAYGTNIIISESTKMALGNGFYCRFIDSVRVKGKKQPVKLYEPLLEGLPDETVKREVETFEHAVSLYQQRKFREAKEYMANLHNNNPHPLYSLYLDRINTFLTTPPPEDWDGVFTFTTK